MSKKSLAFSQSLMDMLYLDIWSYSELFKQMGESLHSLYSCKDLKLVEEIKDDLDTLSKVHVYFEFLRLEWLERLEQSEKQDFKDVQNLLPRKQLTHIPMNISTMQHQLMALWNHVLDIFSTNEPIQKKMANYYNPKREKKLDSPGIFEFQPLCKSFETIDKNTFTEVLYPKSFYDIIIIFFVHECIKREVRFRVCKHCNKFFALTGHINTEYCDRPFDSTGRTCKEMGALRLWKKKAESPALKAFSNAYKKRFAWIKYGKITKEAFYGWAENARGKRELCSKGSITLNEFQAWLDK